MGLRSVFDQDIDASGSAKGFVARTALFEFEGLSIGVGTAARVPVRDRRVFGFSALSWIGSGSREMPNRFTLLLVEFDGLRA